MTVSNNFYDDQADQSVPKRILFYVFSRTDSWVDPKGSCEADRQSEVFSINETNISATEQELPSFMSDWQFFSLNIPTSENRRFFANLTVRDDVISSLPDVFQLNGQNHVSARAREALEALGHGDQNFAPVRVMGKKNRSHVRDDLFVMIPRKLFYHELGETCEIPDIDFSADAFRTPLCKIQNKPQITEFLNGHGFWCLLPRVDKLFICPEVFVRLREAGISGLDEKKNPYWTVYEGQETVGHVYG